MEITLAIYKVNELAIVTCNTWKMYRPGALKN